MTIATTPESAKRTGVAISLRDKEGAPVKRLKFDSPLSLSPDPPSPRPLISSYLTDNFSAFHKIGEGCFGVVHAIKSNITHEYYAVKQSKVDKLKCKSGHNFTKAQLDEVLMHKSLSYHPNIVSFLQAWRQDSTLYLLMELCVTSLDDYWMKRRFIYIVEIELVMDDMLLALQHLGLSNIGHFDLKPANILRTKTGHYKLADFTVASRLDKINKGGEFGDGKYAAPELLNEEFTLKADVYSLGLTLAKISAPSSSPLTSEEWDTLKLEGELPKRVAQVLAGSPKISTKVLRMIERDHHERASVNELLEGKSINQHLAYHQAAIVENTRLRLASNRQRLSLSAAFEREMREPKSPLVAQGDEPLFDTDPSFFIMPSPIRKPRMSLGCRRTIGFQF